MELIKPSKARRTMCEWKGMAAYHDLQFSKDQGPIVNGRIWSYPQPTPSFASIKDYLCFYASSQTDANQLGHWKCVRTICSPERLSRHPGLTLFAPFTHRLSLQMVDDDEVKAQEGDFCRYHRCAFSPNRTGC